MKKRLRLKQATLLLAGPLLLAGCVVRGTVGFQAPPPVTVDASVGGEVMVDSAPPPVIAEQMTVAPGPDFLWIGGGWAWNGRWVWERGHWGHRPRPGAVWMPHHYVYRNGRHVFVRGGWR